MSLLKTTFTELLRVFRIAPSNDTTTAIQVTKSDGSTPIVNIDTLNSNVGIGITNPTYKLDIRGVGGVIGLTQNATGSPAYFVMDNTAETGGKKWRFGYSGDTTSKNSFTFYNETDGASVLSLVNNNVGIGGYTNLGSGSPAIKMKKLTGTTASAQGDAVGVAHGLTASKIISTRLHIYGVAIGNCTDGFTAFPGYLANIYYDNTNFAIINAASNSGNILSKNYVLTVWYEE